MAKRNKHRNLMSCSNIPYALRLKMQKEAEIVDCRDHAARIAMYCTSVALHEIAGIGYQRLARFAVHHKKLVEEFYLDQEVGMAHCAKRMQDFGMPIDGEFYIPPEDGSSKRDRELQTHALQAVQVALILGAIAANDVFGFGFERQKRLCERINELATKYNREGQNFLLEKLEKIGFEIQGGKAMVYLDEEGNAVSLARVRKESDLIGAQS